MIDVTKLTETVTETITTTVNDAVDAVTTASKQFDVSKFDVSKFDVSKFDVTKIDLSKFDVTKIDLPKFDLPKFDLPVDVPAEVDRVADLVRDVTYAGIGMWVVAAQRVDAEVRRLAAKAA